MWKVESINPLEGGVISWSSKIQFRNLRFLILKKKEEEGKVVSKKGEGERGRRGGGGKGAERQDIK